MYKLIFAVMISLYSFSVIAGESFTPPPHYKYKNKQSGEVLCFKDNKNRYGENREERWELIGGPYKDRHCQEAGTPEPRRRSTTLLLSDPKQDDSNN